MERYLQRRRSLIDWYRAQTKTPRAIERCLGALYPSHGRRVFRTETGVAGLGPAASQPGDYVCVLCGAIVPFVLRRRTDHWHLVGECFLPQIMKGECVESARKCGCEDALFVLQWLLSLRNLAREAPEVFHPEAVVIVVLYPARSISKVKQIYSMI